MTQRVFTSHLTAVYNTFMKIINHHHNNYHHFRNTPPLHHRLWLYSDAFQLKKEIMAVNGQYMCNYGNAMWSNIRASWFTGEHETTEQLYMKVLGSNPPPQRRAEVPEAKAAN